MKTLISLIILSSLGAIAAPPLNSQKIFNKEVQVNISRVVNVVNVETKNSVQINLSILDHGGSTDVSPTQQLFLNFYLKGEMFNVDATFDLGPAYSFESIKKLNENTYEILATAPIEEFGNPIKVKILVDATETLKKISKVKCPDDFDCDEAKNFKSLIIATIQAID